MTTATTLLLDTARRGELHHAIILHGPSPKPLRHLAIRIAKALNCLNGTTGDDCAACTRIDRQIYPDVHFVEVAGERKLISIEQIRDLVADASLRPYEGRNKVFIIDPAEALSASSSNALLKTLEEPARDTHFILVARSPDLLLPTIRSRSQAIYIGQSRPRDIDAPLEATHMRQIAMFEKEEASGDLARDLIDLLHRFASRRETAALLAIAALVSDHDDAKEAMALLGAILCEAAALEGRDSIDPEKLTAIRGAIPRERLLQAADRVLAAIRGLTVNADPRLLLEQALASLVV